ncbi:MAG: hypothetical protein ABL893_21070 [Hyphomicrobium sp.]|nr:hypothetical protein [Hyphomicrobium sp.]
MRSAHACVSAAGEQHDCSRVAEDAEEALNAYAIPLAPVRIASRVVYIRSLADGKGVPEFAPHGPAAREIAELFNFISQYGGK